jgi:hypothetical protein
MRNVERVIGSATRIESCDAVIDTHAALSKSSKEEKIPNQLYEKDDIIAGAKRRDR